MRVLWGIEKRVARPSCLALGVFDGVHLGHAKVIGTAVARAAAGDAVPAVLTFDPHPDTVVNPQGAPPLLTTTEEKIGLLRGLGVKLAIIARFDSSLAAMPAEGFAADVLVRRLRARCIAVGANWRFGAGGRGSPELLKQMAPRFGFDVTMVPSVIVKGEPVSSTRLRGLLLGGQLEEANELLGRLYDMGGRVVAGDGLGRKLGFPTANLDLPREKLIPADGVYACWAGKPRSASPLPPASLSVAPSLRAERGEGVRLKWPAICYIGSRPTIDVSRGRRVEVHLLERRGPVGAPGSVLRVELVSRLRPDRRFASTEALVEQMKADVDGARDVLVRIS